MYVSQPRDWLTVDSPGTRGSDRKECQIWLKSGSNWTKIDVIILWDFRRCVEKKLRITNWSDKVVFISKLTLFGFNSTSLLICLCVGELESLCIDTSTIVNSRLSDNFIYRYCRAIRQIIYRYHCDWVLISIRQTYLVATEIGCSFFDTATTEYYKAIVLIHVSIPCTPLWSQTYHTWCRIYSNNDSMTL